MGSADRDSRVAIAAQKWLNERVSLKKFLIEQTLIAMAERTDSAARSMTDVFIAIEAVHSTALEHPEWDLGEIRPRKEWHKWKSKENDK